MSYVARGGAVVGVLTLPKVRAGPVPAVLVIAGSGPTDRDGNQLPDLHPDSYRVIAGGRRVLVVHGDRDTRLARVDAANLAAAANTTPVVLPAKNHVLKDVRDRREEGRSWRDPALPLADGLADHIAAFASASR